MLATESVRTWNEPLPLVLRLPCRLASWTKDTSDIQVMDKRSHPTFKGVSTHCARKSAHAFCFEWRREPFWTRWET